MSFFPSKKRTTRSTKKTKKTKKAELKIVLDSSVESVISEKSDYSKMTVTETVQMDDSVSRKIQILLEQEAILISNKVLPLPSSLIQELLNNHVLSEDIRKGLEEQSKAQLFPCYKIDESENVSLFLQNLVSSKHQIGGKISELAKEAKSKTDTEFENELNEIIKFLTSYKNSTLNYKNLFSIDLLKLNSLFSKLGLFKPEFVVPAIIATFWYITVFYDKKLVDNIKDFEILLEILIEKGNKVICLDQNTVYNLFCNLNIEETLVDSNLFPQIANCIFHPYINDFKVDYLDIFPSSVKFDITKFIKVNETPPVSSADMPLLIPSSLRQKSVQFAPPAYSSTDPLNIYPQIPANETLSYGDNISLQLNNQIDALLPQSTSANIYSTAAITSHSATSQGGLLIQFLVLRHRGGLSQKILIHQGIPLMILTRMTTTQTDPPLEIQMDQIFPPQGGEVAQPLDFQPKNHLPPTLRSA